MSGGAPSTALLGLLVSGALACGLPHDPAHTLERARARGLRVGVATAPPWVETRPGGEPSGVEVELARELARRLGTRIEWHEGDLEQRLEALHRRQLDLVVAGLTTDTPWRGRVGLTRPYHVEPVLVGHATGTAIPESLAGVTVAVELGTPAAARLHDRGARLLALPEHPGAPLIAAPAWKLAAWEYRPFGDPLLRSEHVLAVPPGENRWLLFVERTLSERRAWVGTRLAAQRRP